MGAKIRGAGTETIEIEGVESLHGRRRIRSFPTGSRRAPTSLAAAATRGERRGAPVRA